MMKAAAKRVLHDAGLYETASRQWIWLSPRLTRAIRALTRGNARLTSRYLAHERVPRLHIGCGDNELPGWLNTELDPKGGQIFLDATRPFPFASDQFQYIYSEHMIEHVGWAQGGAMLRECWRVLKPGATIRLVTPDLERLTRLLSGPLTDLERSYLDYCVRTYGLPDGPQPAVHVVNHFMRAWGHQFIYDGKTLRQQLAGAGFTDIVPAPLEDSTHRELSGLAKADRMPAGFLALESLVLEARKPASRQG